jgi:acetylornithine/succinyldiaminopimelate/putrescine aminotransferase
VKHIDFNSFDDITTITDSTAAIIIEPVQGEAGVIVPNNGYLKAIRERCNQTGTLMILDEIQTGMGRTGTMWAFEQEGVVPDILLLAKAFGGGLPLGGFISSRKMMHVLSHDPILGHLTTFGGHPLSCAASMAAFEILEEENILENVIIQGKKIKDQLKDHSAIREVRGRGLMLAIDLKDPERLLTAVGDCRKEGLLVDWFLFNDRSLRLAPPLIISDEEVDVLCKKLISALKSH